MWCIKMCKLSLICKGQKNPEGTRVSKLYSVVDKCTRSVTGQGGVR